jgi:ribonuclease PH
MEWGQGRTRLQETVGFGSIRTDGSVGATTHRVYGTLTVASSASRLLSVSAEYLILLRSEMERLSLLNAKQIQEISRMTRSFFRSSVTSMECAI